jgi:hypothetical protein
VVESDAAMTRSRSGKEEWIRRGDWRDLLATVVSMFAYVAPWFVFQWRWPAYLEPRALRLPPLPATLGLGVGWLVVMVLLLGLVVPSVLARAGYPEMAWRWRHGAIHAAWFGVVVMSVSTGMRLPLSPLLQVLSTMALLGVELLALRWFARRVQGDVARSRRPYS